MGDGIDVLIAATNAANERRQATIDTQGKTTETMINALQKNRQLGLLNRQVSVEEQTLGIKQQELELEKMKAERMLDFENIINLGKIREVAKASRNATLMSGVDQALNNITGSQTDPNSYVQGQQPTQPTQPTPAIQAQMPSGVTAVSGIQAPELDPFTDKPTSKGLQQQALNKQIETRAIEETKIDVKNKEKIKGMETIEGDLDSLLDLYNQIPEEDKGPIEGRTRGVFAKAFGTDVPLSTFEDSSGLVLANISREFGGEKGVLTDADIKRIKSAFPNKTDTDKIAKAKINFIKDFVRRKIDVKKSGASKKTDLSSMSTEELKKLAGI